MMLNVPVTEIYAPIGARLRPNPSIKWQSEVILLVRLYPSITSRATGERKRVSRLMNAVVIMKRMALITINAAADLVLIIPEGISLFFVLGLSASNLLSASLLNPMAAFLAKIIQSIIKRSNLILKSFSFAETASEKPIRAKGIAKIV
jgi:hypothetical protein